MKRHLLRLSMLLIAGVVVNVAVAWSIAIVMPIDCYVNTRVASDGSAL
jgi:hypothetical protein